MSFQAGWEDVAKGKPWRKGYHKWRPNAQHDYETGRLAAIVAKNNGVSITKHFNEYALPGRVIVEINDERVMRRRPDAVFRKLPFVPKVVSLT